MAAPAFDAANGSSAAAATDITTAITVANVANRVLYCCILDPNQVGVNSCTYNTTETMTSIATGSFNAATANWYLYRLIAPTAATANVVTVKTASGAMRQIVCSYNGVSQATPDPDDGFDEAEGSGTAAQNTVTTQAGDTAIAWCLSDGTSTFAPASGETERFDDATASSFYELAGADTTVSFDITLGTSRAWVVVGLNLNAVAAGVTTRRYSLPLTGVG